MKRSSRTSLICAATGAGLTLMLAGCGVLGTTAAPAKSSASHAKADASTAANAATDDLPSASDLYSRAQDVLEKTKTLTVRTHVTVDGETYTVTTRGSVAGTPVAKTYSHPTEGTEELRLIGKALYLKGDVDYWGPDYAGYSGRWTLSPDDEWAREAVSEMRMKSLIDELTDDDGPMAPMLADDAYVIEDNLDGRRMYCLHSADGQIRAWISKDGKNQLARIEGIVYEDGAKAAEEYSGYDGDYSDIVAPKTTLRTPPMDDSPAA